MPNTPSAIEVDPNGLTVAVSFTTLNGTALPSHVDKNGTALQSSPATITVPTTFWLVTKGSVVVSATVGGVENADGAGHTLTVDLSGGGVRGLRIASPPLSVTQPGANSAFETLAHASATYATLLTPVETITYNADGTVATQVIGGVTTTYTYNTDGTVATESRAGVTRTYTYTSGNLTAVA